MREEAVEALRALNETVERLRAPGGCPWDREQTHLSLRPYLLEEAYETLEAIESGSPEALREELGDLLLQVLIHSAIAAEDAEHGFDVGDVAEVTRAKLVHRHPHVFAETTVRDAADVVVNWERLKSAEKRGRLSILEGVPRSLPALAYATGVQKRPARVGFDEVPTLDAALQELAALTRAIAELPRAEASRDDSRGQDWVAVGEAGFRRGGSASPPEAVPGDAEAAVGALLFAAVAVARRLRVNPEDALRRHAAAFADRFRDLESRLRAEGRDVHGVAAEEWAELWSER